MCEKKNKIKKGMYKMNFEGVHLCGGLTQNLALEVPHPEEVFKSKIIYSLPFRQHY